MTTIAQTRARSVSTFADGVVALFREWSDALARRAAYHRTRSELSGLTDRELDDLGLSRWDIDRIARQSVYGR